MLRALAAGPAPPTWSARAPPPPPPGAPPRRCAALAEMGARRVRLALARGAPPPRLAALLAALRLPPDMAHHAAHDITSELASRAASQCAEYPRDVTAA